MIAPSIFSKLVDYIKWIFAFFMNIPLMLKNQFYVLKNNFQQFFPKNILNCFLGHKKAFLRQNNFGQKLSRYAVNLAL